MSLSVYEPFDELERSVYSDADVELYNSIDCHVGQSYGTDTYGLDDELTESGYGVEPMATGSAIAPNAPRLTASATTLKREDNVIALYYWNERLQMLLERPTFTPEEQAQRKQDIAELLDRFVRASTPVVETIVREVNVPMKDKTIKPVDVGGIAGGSKYIHKNLFVKFCSDETAANLYGSAHFAQKAASHEIKSLNALVGTNVAGLHYPLMALILCRGYRLMVVSKLPISPKTLVFGSCDAGKSVYTDPKFAKLLKQATARLNLKPHYCVDQLGVPREVYGPVDLEGHLGKDLRHYVCDTARLFPPTLPMPGVPGCHLYKLFRKEFLLAHCNEKPLSSDAFTHFGSHDRHVHNREAKDAYTRLLTRIIPEAAAKADEWIDQSDLKEAVHQFGINLRYCGYLLKELQDASHKELLLAEMTARLLKNELFQVMRASDPIEPACLAYINAMLFGDNVWQSAWSSAKVYALFARYFEFCRRPSFNHHDVVKQVIDPHLESALQKEELRRRIIKTCCKYAGVELLDVDLDTVSLVEPLTCGVNLVTQHKAMKFEGALSEPKSFEEMEALYLEQVRGEELLPVLNLALLYAFHGFWDKARSRFDQAMELADRRGNALVKCEVKDRYVNALFAVDPRRCEELIASVLEVKRSISGIELELAASLEIAASVALFVGDYVDALRHCEEAFQLKKAAGHDDVEMAKNALLRAKILVISGDLTAAAPLLSDVDRACSNMPFRATRLIGPLRDLQGMHSLQRGKPAEARKYFERAMQAKVELLGSMHLSLAGTYDHCAIALFRAGKLAEAFEYFGKALVVCSSLGHRASFTRGLVLRNQAILLSERGDVEAAEENMQLALEMLPPQLAQRRSVEERNLVSFEFHTEDMTLFSTNVSTSFSVELLSPEIMEVLTAAGVTKEMLADQEQLELIFTCLLETINETTARQSTTPIAPPAGEYADLAAGYALPSGGSAPVGKETGYGGYADLAAGYALPSGGAAPVEKESDDGGYVADDVQELEKDEAEDSYEEEEDKAPVEVKQEKKKETKKERLRKKSSAPEGKALSSPGGSGPPPPPPASSFAQSSSSSSLPQPQSSAAAAAAAAAAAPPRSTLGRAKAASSSSRRSASFGKKVLGVFRRSKSPIRDEAKTKAASPVEPEVSMSNLDSSFASYSFDSSDAEIPVVAPPRRSPRMSSSGGGGGGRGAALNAGPPARLPSSGASYGAPPLATGEEASSKSRPKKKKNSSNRRMSITEMPVPSKTKLASLMTDSGGVGGPGRKTSDVQSSIHDMDANAKRRAADALKSKLAAARARK